MIYDNGEIEVVFCVELPPENVAEWISENAPGFVGVHPDTLDTILDDGDADYFDNGVIQRNWVVFCRLVDLCSKTEMHAHCRSGIYARDFESFLERVLRRFPETHSDLQTEMQDPDMRKLMPGLLTALEVADCEPEKESVERTADSSASEATPGEGHKQTPLKGDGQPQAPSLSSPEPGDAATHDHPEASNHGGTAVPENKGRKTPLEKIKSHKDRVMVMKLLQGYTDPEIARQLGLKAKSVSNRLSRLRGSYPGLVPTREDMRQNPSLAEKLLPQSVSRESSGNKRERWASRRESM